MSIPIENPLGACPQCGSSKLYSPPEGEIQIHCPDCSWEMIRTDDAPPDAGLIVATPEQFRALLSELAQCRAEVARRRTQAEYQSLRDQLSEYRDNEKSMLTHINVLTRERDDAKRRAGVMREIARYLYGYGDQSAQRLADKLIEESK